MRKKKSDKIQNDLYFKFFLCLKLLKYDKCDKLYGSMIIDTSNRSNGGIRRRKK